MTFRPPIPIYIAPFLAIGILLISSLLAAPPAKQHETKTEMKLTKPPEGLDPFYKKHVSVGGLPVVGSEKVSDYALFEAAYLIDNMLGDRDDLRRVMIKNKVRFAVMAYSERTTQIPEHSDLKPSKFWDRRARGLGATPARPAVSCGEENLLAYDPGKSPKFAWSEELLKWYRAYQDKKKQSQSANAQSKDKTQSKEKKANEKAEKESLDKPSEPDDSNTGAVEGRVIYQIDPKRRWRYARYYISDSKNGSLAEAVVAVESKGLKEYPQQDRGKTVVVDQKDFRFAPETTAIRAGDRVKFTNSDNQVHNVFTRHPRHSFDESIASGEIFYYRFGRAVGMRRPVVLGCRFHSTMKAWIFVLGHPFYQVTKADGKFRLENVPPGEYQLEMRHPAGNLRWSRKIVVGKGRTLKIDIRVSPDDIAK